MIDPKLLTKEAGFYDSEPVEVEYENEVKEVGYFPVDDWNLDNKKIVSIRPFAGPMAVWNFAPDWATFAEVRLGGIAWLTEAPKWFDGTSEAIQARPWWAQKKS